MLDPDIAQMMQAMQDNGEPPLFKDTTGEKARQRGVEIRARYYPPVLKHVARIEERSVPGQAGDLPVRVYWPENPTGATIVFFHGGGWIIGDLDSHDGHARRLAATVGAVVVHWSTASPPKTHSRPATRTASPPPTGPTTTSTNSAAVPTGSHSPVTAPAATSPPASPFTAATPGENSPVNY